MRYLFTKMRRDIAQLWVQFFSVFMMAVLAITIYSGMEGVWYGLKCEVEDYYRATNLADVWVNGADITADMVDDISALDGVEKVEQSMTVTVSLETEEDDKPDVKLLAMDALELFNPEIRDGEAFDKASEDGIWLDETIAEKRDIAVGDAITLKYGSMEKTFTVKGLILDSEFIYYTGSVTDTVPNHTIHGYGLIGTEAAKQFYGTVLCNELRLDVAENCDYAALQSKVEDILGDAYYSFSERDDISSVSQITKEIHQMQNMANLFSAVFILLALLSMYTTMTRLINTQMVQIGTLKALGFTNSKIRLHYIFYGFFVSLFGCLLGTVFGQNLVSRAVMRVKEATLTMPDWRVSLSYRTYLIIAGIVVVCLIATLFATRKGLHKLPAETMRATAAGSKERNKSFDAERFGLWNRLQYNTKWMIRDILQNKVRWMMSIIGVAGSMVLMMAGLGFRDSINYSNDYVYNQQYTYQYKVVLAGGYTEAEYDDLQKDIQGESQEVYEYNLELYYEDSDDKEMRTISVVGDGDFVNLETLDGRPLSLSEDTVAISKKIAEKLDVKEGDTVRCRMIGEKDFIDLKVTNVVIAPSPQGIFLSKAYWEQNLDRTFVPSALLLKDEADYDAVHNRDIVKETATIDDQLASMKVMTKSVMTIIYLMVVASVLLGCIIIYNLGMLNYIERLREYATMKVLGFYQREVRGIIIRDCMITTLIGWLLGIPAGYQFLHFYIGVVQFKSFEWVPTLSSVSLVVASVAVILCSLLVNLIVAHKVTKISMVEALKSVE